MVRVNARTFSAVEIGARFWNPLSVIQKLPGLNIIKGSKDQLTNLKIFRGLYSYCCSTSLMINFVKVSVLPSSDVQ